jgi:predicted nucleic acid-binding protein
MLSLTNEYIVILDACVLAPMPLADTLLRLAQEPALFQPRWTDTILHEVHRTLTDKLHRTKEQADRRIAAMRTHFEEALVENYEVAIPAMRNHEKDRHVLAAAFVAGADAIVTSNVRDFPDECVTEYDIEIIRPGDFLVHQYHLDEDLVVEKIRHQAKARGKTIEQQLVSLERQAEGLVDLVRAYLMREDS